MIDKELFVYNIDFLYDHIEYHLDNPTIQKKIVFFRNKECFLLVNQSMYMDNNEQNNKYHYHLEIYMSR